MSDGTLQTLITGCLKGKRKSQEKLYQRFYPYGMSVCLRYTDTEEEAIEVLNDGFMKVFAKLETFDQQKPFQSWFRRILINTSINHYHKNEKHKHHQPIEEGNQVADERSILSHLSYEEMIRLIQDLSPVYRTVFNLFVIDGYTHEEIAEALQISVGASKSNLFRARANLRVMLKKNSKIACKV
ncbi:RNA polymerase sigma factor (sigma-70 family) [Catalinimonas alkaloidigena]|uniref:RNA polymerase sigma factor n=1 Tax=Catalinimonas alkaloidigena TaxID=1075417 RepID=UPI002406D07B|nr:sigma-70 family RNA polymerase sigma factor [Catalinimonas alkaloidigena]MDF9798740.1 RNA polymerase sigma factor (sigma-70 family) [Catalinimonas alkaloidigena]